MSSSEIQNYLSNKNYKLTFKEYLDLVDYNSQITCTKLERMFDFYSKILVSTIDGYSWCIYVLNYDKDISMLDKIVF